MATDDILGSSLRTKEPIWNMLNQLSGNVPSKSSPMEEEEEEEEDIPGLVDEEIPSAAASSKRTRTTEDVDYSALLLKEVIDGMEDIRLDADVFAHHPTIRVGEKDAIAILATPSFVVVLNQSAKRLEARTLLRDRKSLAASDAIPFENSDGYDSHDLPILSHYGGYVGVCSNSASHIKIWDASNGKCVHETFCTSKHSESESELWYSAEFETFDNEVCIQNPSCFAISQAYIVVGTTEGHGVSTLYTKAWNPELAQKEVGWNVDNKWHEFVTKLNGPRYVRCIRKKSVFIVTSRVGVGFLDMRIPPEGRAVLPLVSWLRCVNPVSDYTEIDTLINTYLEDCNTWMDGDTTNLETIVPRIRAMDLPVLKWDFVHISGNSSSFVVTARDMIVLTTKTLETHTMLPWGGLGSELTKEGIVTMTEDRALLYSPLPPQASPIRGLVSVTPTAKDELFSVCVPKQTEDGTFTCRGAPLGTMIATSDTTDLVVCIAFDNHVYVNGIQKVELDPAQKLLVSHDECASLSEAMHSE